MPIAIAGERSGVGKTTVTLALLAALKQRGLSVQSFKVGPDYIDPMFHSYVTGRACRNLDPILTSPDYVRQCFARHSVGVDCAVVEGVMGLFDGASGATDAGSTAQVAKLIDVPVVLILNCSSTSRSIAAIAHGYRTFDPQVRIAGVILNRVGSDRHLELLTAALSPLDLPILGVLRRCDDISLPDRHLGLIPAQEQTELDTKLDRLAHLGATCFDWERLLPLLTAPTSTELAPGDFDVTDLNYDRSFLQPSLSPSVLKRCSTCGALRTGSPPAKVRQDRGNPKTALFAPPLPLSPSPTPPIRIAIAQDAAFNFYYADNLDLLRQLGAELVEWSPLADPKLPPDVWGMYFGGGFPEVFAEQLATNHTAIDSIRSAIYANMPTYAECGGLMYLCDRIVDFEDKSYSMVGIFPAAAVMGKRLTLGYRQVTARCDSLLLKVGDRLWGHEFHRSTLSNLSDRPLYDLHGYESNANFAPEGWTQQGVQAAYTHLHFGARPALAARLIERCQQFRSQFIAAK